MAAPNPVVTFLHEAEDLLAQIEENVLDFDQESPDVESVNRLFRAFHTIKGSGAMFGFEAVAAFTHHVETALDKVRSGEVRVTQPLLDLVLGAKDRIKGLLDAGPGTPDADPKASERIICALSDVCGGAHPASRAPSAASETAGAAEATGVQTFRVRFRPDAGMMLCGTSPISILNELRSLGECDIVADTGGVLDLKSIQPDQIYLSWEITLTTDKGRNAIKDVFIFVEDGSAIEIEAIGEASSAVSTATPPSMAQAAQRPMVAPDAPEAISPRGEQPASGQRKPSAKEGTIRVPSEKLDRLVNLVGELVMNQSRLTQVASRLDSSDLAVPVEEIERLVAELRDNVLGIRMMPIGSTFSRFKRLVHDLSGELGKEIDLVTEGAETELDKTVLDQLGDPLVHLIRNSLDHGIEPTQQREVLGKPRRGTIRLAAAHTGSNVVVTIQDDGKGLDTAVIRSKAIEKGLIPADTSLSESETFNLIFLPGFSTAKQITSISGRGVGMDVVKRQIDALRGTVSISSEPGKGTSIALTLPLTLAIIDGLLVEIGRDQFIIPMSFVTENVELQRHERSRNNGRNLIAVRGELVPYLRLRDSFGVRDPEIDVEKVVIVRHENQRVGLVVDRVLGSHQTVIQSLGRFYKSIGAFSGATIMGDGRVALILDLGGVVRSIGAPKPTLSQELPHF